MNSLLTRTERRLLEWLQHCFNIIRMCCAKNRRCEFVPCNITFKVRSVKGVKKNQTITKLLQNESKSNVRIARFTTHVQTCFVTNQVVAWCVNTDFCLDKIALELRHLGSYVTFGPENAQRLPTCTELHFSLFYNFSTTLRNLQLPDLPQDRLIRGW